MRACAYHAYVQETWAEYVRRVTERVAQKDVAERTGVDQTGISRWIRGKTKAPRAESVVSFARGLQLSPVEALIAAGYLDVAEAASAVAVAASVSDLSNDALIDELRDRLHHVESSARLTRIKRHVEKIRIEQPDQGHEKRG